MKINPNEFASAATSSIKKELSEGIKSFVPVGCRYGQFKTGTKYLEVGHVCIETDKDPLKEVGATFYCRFPLTQNMLWALGNYAYAIGYRKEFFKQDRSRVPNFSKNINIWLILRYKNFISIIYIYIFIYVRF